MTSSYSVSPDQTVEKNHFHSVAQIEVATTSASGDVEGVIPKDATAKSVRSISDLEKKSSEFTKALYMGIASQIRSTSERSMQRIKEILREARRG